MEMKFKVGDLVYAYDTYRGIIGKVSACHPLTEHSYSNHYVIDIIKKTQETFYVKRWDNESFWENDLHTVLNFDDKFVYTVDNFKIPIKSNEEIIKIQANYSFGGINKLILLNNFV